MESNTNSAISAENVDSPVVVDSFEMGITDVPFLRLKAIKDTGDAGMFKTMVEAMTMIFGKGAEVIEAGFNTAMRVSTARTAIEKFEKELAGYTAGASLLKLLSVGEGIAKDGGGSVTYTISLIKEEGKPDSAVVKAGFHSIGGGATRASGGKKGRFQYFDGGVALEMSLKKHILAKYPNSKTAKVINDYEANPVSAISAWVAAQRGMKDGDKFIITRKEK
jgi:hypothetical protein